MTDAHENSSNPDLERLARAVIDGTPVDWGAELEQAGTASGAVEQLRILAELASLNVTLPGASGDVSPPPGPYPLRWGALTLQEKIGEGTFGEVFRAWDDRLAREVALKLLFAAGAGVTAARGVIDEGRLLARVRHPNVLTVYGAEEIDGRLGIWTELIEGETLASLVQTRGPLSESEAVEIGLVVCWALEAVHKTGLLHRDIKAQNVMRATDGRIVLMDFGASHEAEDRVRAVVTGTPGTPLYLAPELWEGASPSKASDIYALGVLLFFLLTGSYPVFADTVQGIMDAHRAGRRRQLRHVRPQTSKRTAEAIERALTSDPRARFVSLAQFAEALGPRTSGATCKAVAAPRFYIVASILAAAVATLVSIGRPTSRPALDARPSTSRLELLCNDACRPSPDGRFITHTRDGNLWIWHVATGESRQVTQRQDSPERRGSFPAAATTADGEWVTYAWRSPDQRQSLMVSDLRGLRERTIIPIQADPKPLPIQWAADRRHILCWLIFSDGRSQLALIDSESGRQRILNSFPNRPYGAALSPDGRYVVYDQPAPGASSQRDIFIAAVHSPTPRVLAPHPTNDAKPFFTADGKNVMFSSLRSGVTAQWLLPIRDGIPQAEPTLIAQLPHGAEPFSLTDDGSLFYWLPNHAKDVYIQAIDLSGSRDTAPGRRVDPTVIGGHSSPAWSADGQLLSYISDRSFGPDALAVLDMSDGRRRELPLQLGGRAEVMRWAPDNNCLGTIWIESGDRSLRCIDRLTGAMRALWTDASAPLSMSDFEWSADGNSILLYDPRRGVVERALESSTERVLARLDSRPFSTAGRLRLAPHGNALAYNGRSVLGSEPIDTVLLHQPLGGAVREIFRGTPGERVFVQGWTPTADEVLVSRFTPAPEPSAVTYQLWAIPTNGGPARDLGVRVPGFTEAHDITVGPKGDAIAYTHFATRRFAEMWVMRNTLPRR